MHYAQPNSDNLSVITGTTGVVLTPASAAGGSPGVTLANSTTYYVPLASGVDGPLTTECPLVHAHLKWASAVAATITIESSSFAKYVGGGTNGPVDVSDYDATTGNWIQENTAGSGVVTVVGTGNSATALTITAGGTNAGAASINLINLGAKRLRLKIVVTTGGLLRVGVNGKAGG